MTRLNTLRNSHRFHKSQAVSSFHSMHESMTNFGLPPSWTVFGKRVFSDVNRVNVESYSWFCLPSLCARIR